MSALTPDQVVWNWRDAFAYWCAVNMMLMTAILAPYGWYLIFKHLRVVFR